MFVSEYLYNHSLVLVWINLYLRWLFTPRAHVILCTFYEPMTNGKSNVLWNSFYWPIWFYIIIAQWSCEPQILSSNPYNTFVKSYWNNFLKIIFSSKLCTGTCILFAFLVIHIYYMLPHLSLLNFFVLIWETLSRCVEPP